jgi:hypothetical protein
METHWLQVRIVGGTAMMRIARLARRGLDMRFLALWIGIEVGSAAWAAGPVPSTTGCPMFHCTVEATGVISEALLSHPTTVLSSSALGTIEHQGCSGDGPRIACLFTADAVTSGIGRGTLKVLDATTLQPIWGSGGVPDSYDIDPSSFSTGQVPLLFANGSLAAGDSYRHVLYSSTGQVLKSLTLNGRGNNMGMTPVSDKYGVITQTNGTFTLVDLATWTKVHDLTVKAEGSNVRLWSPSTGSSNVLYAVGDSSASDHGFLFALSVQPDGRGDDKLVLRATFTSSGRPTTSAVIVKPQTTGFAGNLLLLYVPGLPGDGTSPVNRLMGLLDDGSGTFSQAWPAPIVLDDKLNVTPAVDEVSRSLFFRYGDGALIYRHDLLSGGFVEKYDIASAGGFPNSFAINGHLTSNLYGGAFTLLLSGSYKQRRGGASAQIAAGFQPLISPTSLLWSRKIVDEPDSYTAAWVIGPATSPGYYCPIVVGRTSGISRVCD